MKLQIALDDVTLEEGLALVSKVQAQIDIIEIGTPLIYQEGMRAVRLFRKRFPEKEILADMKIMDAGEYEAKQGFEAGADYVTVLGITDSRTIEGCLAAAKKFHTKIAADMICVPDMEKRIGELESLGVWGLAVHTGTDQQAAGRTPLDDLRTMTACCKKAAILVAGGISEETVKEYAMLKPEILIAGSGICHAKDPGRAAETIRKQMDECESRGQNEQRM